MGLIEDFIARYRKEYDFYDQAARLVAQTLDANLQAAGIRSMVTSRAKAVTRLEAKVRQRAPLKNYTSVEDIYSDVVDLAGARVALYFPGERQQVDKLVKQLFLVAETPKDFPSGSEPSYKKRFSGYWATHYRVQLKEALLAETHKRYAEAKVEVQVASVLMHAWAEVEHDLVYKPMEGALSGEEYAILDELNGLVIAGEIALERLQKAGESRVAAGGRRFSNHYDLAAHILNRTSGVLGELADSALGRVDMLFELLKRLEIDTPDKLEPYIEALHIDTERRPIAEQIIDRLLAEDGSRYKVYEDVRAAKHVIPGLLSPEERLGEPEVQEAIGYFLSQWVTLERLVRELTPERPYKRPSFVSAGPLLEELGVWDPESRIEFERIRRLRNNLVHGIEAPHPADLREAGDRLRVFIHRFLGARFSQPLHPTDYLP